MWAASSPPQAPWGGCRLHSTLNLEAGTLNMSGFGIGTSATPIATVNILDQGGSSFTLTNLGGTGIYATGGNAASNGGLTVPSVGSNPLILDGTNTYTGGTVVSRTLQVGQSTSANLFSPLGNSSGTVTMNSGTLNFNSNNAILVANPITGSGTINQNGNGTTTLNSTSSFAGQVNINAGTLAIEGTLNNTGSPQPITIGGGNLAGSGTTGDDVTLNNGSITPDATGTPLNVNSLTMNGGTLQFNVNGANIGKINSANFASLSGGQLSFGLISAPTLSSYTILTSTSLSNSLSLSPFMPAAPRSLLRSAEIT